MGNIYLGNFYFHMLFEKSKYLYKIKKFSIKIIKHEILDRFVKLKWKTFKAQLSCVYQMSCFVILNTVQKRKFLNSFRF